MNLIIKRTPGELYSIFSSLLFACNINYFKNQIVEQWGMEIDEELEKDIEEIRNNKNFDLEEAKTFFDINLNIPKLFIDPDFLWHSETLDEYFQNIKNQNPEVMRQKIIHCLELDNTEQNLYGNDVHTLHLIMKLLKEQPLDNEIKWNLLCLIEDPITYVEKFTELINRYLPLYEEIKKKYNNKFEDFILWLEEQIKTHGTDYINHHFEIVNFNQFEKVYFSYSIFDLGSTYLGTDENQCYLYLGMLFKQYVQQKLDKQDVEKHLMVYKNFSDKTRFDIIRMLIEKDCFGQEIAEKLGITTATVSYHMDYLLGASLVQVTRKSRKIFYSINKDVVRQSILFLEQELKL